VRERLLAVLALHQPLDGLSEHTLQPAHPLPANSAARDERKEKSRWDDEQHAAAQQPTDELDADEAETDGGSLTAEQPSASAEADVGTVRFPSESAQHAAHRARDLLHSSWSAVLGSSSVPSVWESCFASSFNSRCQELVAASFARFKFHETIESALEHWKDGGDGDGAVGSVGWSAAAVSSMWSGYRQSAVTALVSSFALQLERLAADIRHLLHCSLADVVRQATAQQATGGSAAATSGQLLYPFDYLSFLSLPRFLDDELSPSLHRLYTASVHSMAEQLKRRLAALDHSVLTLMASESSWRSNECRVLVERAVFIGRCCASITQQTAFASFSQALQQPSAVPQQHSAAAAPLSFSSASSSPIVAALSSTARSAFRIWSRFVAATVSDEMETAFAAWRKAAADTQRQPTAALSNSQSDGAVPSQPSAYIHRVLWSVQHHTYSTHGYQTPSEVLRWMMQDTNIALTAVVQAQLELHHLAQHDDEHEQQARQRQQRQGATAAPFAAAPLGVLLQLYFDLLFLLSMMRLPSEAGGPPHKAAHNNRHSSPGLAVLEYVEGVLADRVSAADWPALRTSLISSCLLCLQRTQLLFGLLAKRNPLPPLQLVSALDGSMANMTPAAAHASTTTSAAATGASQTSTAASGLPLAATSSRIMTFSTSFYTHTKQQQPQQVKQPTQQQQLQQQSASSSSSAATRPAVSAVPIAVAASISSSGSSVAANAASVASESAALLKEKGRQLLGKWNLV